MKVIHRYVGGQLVSRLVTVLAAVVVIYAAIDFFEKIDDFMEAQVPLSTAGIFFLLRVPFVVAQVMPVGVLLAALLTFGLMAKHHEITAYRAGGGAVKKLLVPVFWFAVVSTAFLFFFSEVAVPMAARKANRIWFQEVKKEGVQTGRENDVWFSGDRFIAHVGQFLPLENRALALTAVFFDPDYHLVKRVDARAASIEGGAWRLSDAIIQENGPEGLAVTHPAEATLDLPLKAEDLSRVVRRPDEMSYHELDRYARRIRDEGYDASRYFTDAAGKLAFPFVTLILGIFGGAIALRKKQGEGLAVGVVLGILIAFGYFVFYSLCLALGYAGTAPPWLAAWTANAVFAAAAAVFVLRLE